MKWVSALWLAFGCGAVGWAFMPELCEWDLSGINARPTNYSTTKPFGATRSVFCFQAAYLLQA